ncbi:MBL fold metallo-hydrolase [Bacillus swezeyi]|uniref:Metallo-beta-lactamase domain-containing protein n=1 Tax=Bacillus swezeyi TaxID=1925020 RepID=A0A1R1S2V8_9BACI|nr:MBL fold metallo-hydrolase [Bacillus swezeyi]MEC1261907.1 MBL fold metallo-hydrolase [Bacillus swezeyi]MED2930296.1 MBL fold metallo-hydrolase [Bacillus swezeyi]MED2944490.1 MBL fold metallo-hydrolase [Bacillus swezeyi]MED2966207.1 MBL fold metallo-hydrolase [Bacillus swezeyi]MED2976802.1 MBL fold metallo-hydrolase [Bacillus swezeyi]
MKNYICTTCGVQYDLSAAPPAECIICNEERQYVNPDGQAWTTLEELKQSRAFQNEICFEEEHLYSLTTKPRLGIGQTAYLIQESGFHLLWDCITYLDQKTIEDIKKLGGIQAVALSHPHYYSTQAEWAEAFDAPIYIHEDDKEWVQRPSERIVFWSGESLELSERLTLHRLGGHFKGGAVCHWKNGDGGNGILLTGDIIQVVQDQEWVSFMYSYPNLIPLPARKVKQMADQVKDIPFNRLYNAFHRAVKKSAGERVQQSAERYIKAVDGTLFST